MGGVAPCEATLDAGMAAIGLAILPRHHAHDFLAAHFRLEGAADAAIGAGGDHGVLGRADLDDRFFLQGRGRAGLHTGAAGDAFRTQECLMHAGRDAGFESAALDRQRKGALHLFAGPHAARADDAFGRIIGEIRIALVLRHEAGIGFTGGVAGEDVVLAGIAVAHIAKTHGAGHVLQLAVAVGRTGQAVERVIGNIEFHHALAQLLQPVRLGVNHHAGFNRCCAGGRCAAASVDLDKAEAAGTEGIDHVGRAELRDADAGFRGCAHHRRADRYGNLATVDGECNGLFRAGCGGAVVHLSNVAHGFAPLSDFFFAS